MVYHHPFNYGVKLGMVLHGFTIVFTNISDDIKWYMNEQHEYVWINSYDSLWVISCFEDCNA